MKIIRQLVSGENGMLGIEASTAGIPPGGEYPFQIEVEGEGEFLFVMWREGGTAVYKDRSMVRTLFVWND